MAIKTTRIRGTLYGSMLLAVFLVVFYASKFMTTVQAKELSPQESPIVFDNLSQISPDGKYIVSVSAMNLGMENSTIWISKSDGTSKQELISGDGTSWVTNPIWAPSGDQIAYLKVIRLAVSAFESNSRFEIWSINIDGSHNILLSDSEKISPALGFGGKTNILWTSDNTIIFSDETAYPAKRYALDVSTLTLTEIDDKQPIAIQTVNQPSGVPYFNQCNNAWGGNTLGTCSGSTICGYGCAITATAMVFKYYGVNTDPGALNSWLTNNGGYASGCYIYWATAANIDSKITWVASITSQDWTRLRSELDAGYPIIVEVNNSGTQHFVVVTGYSGSTYYINDPAYSSRTTLASYGNSFVGMRIYHGSGGGGACSAPSLSNPSDGYISSGQTINFSWSAVSGCTFNGYTFRIKDTSNMDSGGSTIVDTGEGGTSRTETIGSQWNNRDLYWGVKAANAPNGASWSVRRFRIEPGGGGCNPNADQVALFVDANYGGTCVVKGIGNYPNPSSLGIANDSVSSIKVGSNVKLTLCRDDNYASTCETFQSDDSNLSDNGIGDNQVSSAKVENRNTPPPAPSLSNPGNGSSNPYNYDLTFQWNSSSGATEYLIEWWGGPYSTMQPCGWSSSTSCHVGTVAAGNTYSWHVKARNSAGESGWSSTWTFTIQSNAVPDLVIQSITASPSNPSLNQPVTFTIRVKNQGTGDATSGFYVDLFIDSQPGSCPTDGITYWNINSLAAGATQDLTYTYAGFSTSGTHNLYAFADSYCNISESNEGNNILGPVTLSVQNPQPPPAPSLSSPGNGSSNPYNYDLTFQWNSSSGATEYLVEWWGGPYSTMQPCGWSGSTSCHIGTVAAGNTYSWHVKARNSAGESGWSGTWTFTISPGNQTLTVTKNGTGSGTVTSSPAGINCGSTCSASFTSGTVVILTATPTSPSTFGGWSGGGCYGTGTCTVTMSSAQSVTATFQSGATDDNYEENDILATAYDLSSSEQTWLSTINGYGIQADDDWYSIYVTPGYENILVDLRFTHSQGDIDVILYDSAGNVLASSTSITDNEYIDYTVPVGGDYYFIRVYYENHGNQYDLWWDDIQPGSPTVTVTIPSGGATADGWILESTETSNKGGTLNSTATTFNLGDGVADKQYRAILHFNTTSLPDNAVITKVTLKIKKQGLMGTNPFTTHGGLKVDIRMPFFGSTTGLVISDFQATASKSAVGTFSATPVSNWYSAILGSGAYPYLNLTGTTQFRLRFAKDDNDDMGVDYMRFFSANYPTVSARPTLIIEYYIP